MLILESILELRMTLYDITKRAHKIVLDYFLDDNYIEDMHIRDADDALETMAYLITQQECNSFTIRWFDTGLEKKRHVVFYTPNRILVTSHSPARNAFWRAL